MGSTYQIKSTSLWRKIIAVLAAVCMVASMWPATALAYPDYVENYAQASDSKNEIVNGGNGSVTSTDVKIAVTTDFSVVVDNTEAIAIEDARKLATGDYVLEGTLAHGVPFNDGDVSYYEYKWTRQRVVAGEVGTAATLVDDAEYNVAQTWMRADVQDVESGETAVMLNLYDVRDTFDFDNQAQYVYTLVGRDKTLSRSSANTVRVACTAHYKDVAISTKVANGDIWASGLMHIGDPQLHATTLGVGSSAYSLIQQSSEGYTLDGVYDLAITEQQAANEDNDHTAYLEPLTYIQIPLSSDVKEDADLRMYGIFASGANKGLVYELTKKTIFLDEETGVRYVQVNTGAIDGDDNRALVCGVFAVAYKLKENDSSYKPAVKVTSKVEGEGGLIDIMGAHYFAQGTTVRYTFLPSEGYVLSKVDIYEGDPDSSEPKIIYPGQDDLRANWLDYTVNPSKSESPEDITIIAHFAPADISGIEDKSFKVTAETNDPAKGSVSIDGGSLNNGIIEKTVKAGNAVTVHFIPVETSILHYVEMTTDGGKSWERPQVLNSTLTIPSVTSDTRIIAHFEYGTPVIYPDVNIRYADTQNGIFADGNPTVRPYGESATVNVQPNEGYKVEEVWFTFNDDPDTRYPLRYTGGGISWIIDYVLKDLTVHAAFAPTALPVRIVSNEGGSVVATYIASDGKEVTEGIEASDTGVTLGLDPNSDLVLLVTPDDTKTVEVSLVPKGEGASLLPLVSANGVYSLINDELKDEGIDYIKVEFRDITVGPIPPDPVEEFFKVTPHIVDKTNWAAGDINSTNANGSVSPSTEFLVGKGGTATLNFQPKEKFRTEVTLTPGVASSWVVVDKMNYSIFDIQKDTDVYICFVADDSAEKPRESHTIEATVFGDEGGTISPAGDVSVAHGGFQSFSFVPDEGYALSYVIIDADTEDERICMATELNSASQYMFVGVNRDHTITAVFAKDEQLKDIVVWDISAGDNGSAIPSGKVPCRVSDRGRSVIVIPDEGYVIKSITIEENGKTKREVDLASDSAFDGSVFGGTYSLPTISGGGGKMHVEFESRPQQATVHVNVKGQGGSASPNGDSVALIGSQQTITFVPYEGYELDYARFTNKEGVALTNGDFTDAAIKGDYSYSFKVSGETWIECAYKPLDEGENPPVDPGDPISITAVSIGTGKISPYGQVRLYPKMENSKVTFTLLPNAGSKLVQLTVGNTDVTNKVVGGQYTLLAKDAHNGDEVRAIFETIEPIRGKVELTAGTGGQISPAGMIDVVVGDRLPMSFLPSEGMQTDTLQLTYRNDDGTTWTTTKLLYGQTSYAISSVSADLVEAHVTFKKGASPKPTQYTVRAKVADSSKDLGSVSPGEDKLVTVNTGGAAMFTFSPKAGYRVKSVTLNGGENLISGGSTSAIHYYVPWNELKAVGADKTTAVLEVAFEKIEVNPDWVNIVVGVETSTTRAARSGIEAGAGGFVSPHELTVKFASTDNYEFYVLPDDGFVIDTIEASVDGGKPQKLDYDRKGHSAKVNNMQDIAEGRASYESNGEAGSGDKDADDGSANNYGSARYYTFELTNIVGNVDVKVNFRTLGEGDTDDAMNGEGKRVELTVGSSEGGTISPSGTVTLPAGCTYPFIIQPDSATWEPTALVITYEDGTTKLITDISSGRYPIKIEPGMKSLYVSFEQIGHPTDTVRITATAEGPGEIAPCGGFNVAAGTPSQSFSLKFNSQRAYIKSLIVKTAGEDAQDMVEQGAVWKFDVEYALWNVKADTEVHVVFAEGEDDNPTWGDVEYVPVRAYAATDGTPSTEGGTIEPASSAAPSGVMQFVKGSKQAFQFRPNRGFIVDAVSITTGAGSDASVRTLSAEEIESREVVLDGIEQETSIVVNFIPTFYTVDVTSSEGGSFDIEGKGIKVRQGQKLALYAEPDSGHELERIDTKGLVVHEDTKAEEVKDQVSRTASLGGRAKDRSELHTFAVAGSGAVHGTFISSKGDTEDPSNPSNPSDPGKDPSDPSGPDNPNNPGNSGNPAGPNNPSGSINPGANTVEAGMPCKVVVSTSGNGEVNPKGELSVISGSTLTLTLTPAVGFYPVSVTIKDAAGTRTVANATRTYSAVITGNCELIANFATSAAPGSANPINRTIRTLQSLAKTGDNAYAGILALTAIACAGVGVMILTSKRRRKEEQAEE